MEHTLIHQQVNASLVASSIVLDECIEKHGVGYFDGGCLTFALGAQQLIEGSELYHVSRTAMTPDHIVLYIPQLDQYLDADGLHTKAKLMDKMRRIELVDVQVVLPATSVSNLAVYDDIVDALVVCGRSQ